MPPPIPNSYILPNPRFTAGEYPGAPYTKSDAQLRARLDLFLSAGICAFIDLTSTTDPLKPYEPTLRSIAQERSIEVSHERLTIPDMGVSDAAHMRRVLDTIDAHLADGRHVYVHCWGGVGRTGTVVGCWLVRHGMTGDEAIDQVQTLFNTMSPKKLADHPEGSPQTEPQRAMVRNWREPGHSPKTESA